MSSTWVFPKRLGKNLYILSHPENSRGLMNTFLSRQKNESKKMITEWTKFSHFKDWKWTEVARRHTCNLNVKKMGKTSIYKLQSEKERTKSKLKPALLTHKCVVGYFINVIRLRLVTPAVREFSYMSAL